MKVLVCFKITGDSEHLVPSELKAICKGEACMEYVPKVIGSFDEAALESALRLRDMAKESGVQMTLIALTVGKNENSRFLKDLYALQFDHVVHCPYDDDLDFYPERVAEIIINYVRSEEDFDMIITGQQASPGEDERVPFIISGEMGIPCVPYISDMELSSEARIKVTRKTDGGQAILLVKNPAVYAVEYAKHPYLRVATLREKITLGAKDIEKFYAKNLFLDADTKPILKSISYPEEKRECVILNGNNIKEKIVRMWENHVEEVYD